MDELILERLDKRIALVLPLLNERQRRLYLAAETLTGEENSISLISRISGVSRNTITSGIRELEGIDSEEGIESTQKIRKSGAGRKKIDEEFPGLQEKILELLKENGEESIFFSWCGLSTREIREKLKDKGYWIGRTTVANILENLGYIYCDNKANLHDLESAIAMASEKKIPVIELEIVGTIHEDVPVQVWDFIKNWWETDTALVISSLDYSASLFQSGIRYFPYPKGYLKWKHRKICATVRTKEKDGNEIRCIFWELSGDDC